MIPGFVHSLLDSKLGTMVYFDLQKSRLGVCYVNRAIDGKVRIEILQSSTFVEMQSAKTYQSITERMENGFNIEQ